MTLGSRTMRKSGCGGRAPNVQPACTMHKCLCLNRRNLRGGNRAGSVYLNAAACRLPEVTPSILCTPGDWPSLGMLELGCPGLRCAWDACLPACGEWGLLECFLRLILKSMMPGLNHHQHGTLPLSFLQEARLMRGHKGAVSAAAAAAAASAAGNRAGNPTHSDSMFDGSCSSPFEVPLHA